MEAEVIEKEQHVRRSNEAIVIMMMDGKKEEKGGKVEEWKMREESAVGQHYGQITDR